MGTLDALPSRSGDNCGVRDSTSSKYWNFIVKSVHVLALWMPVGPRLARTEPTHWWSRSLVSWGWRWRSPLWLRLWRSATNPCTCPWRNVGHSRRSYIHPSEQNVPARRLLNACILTLFFYFIRRSVEVGLFVEYASGNKYSRIVRMLGRRATISVMSALARLTALG